MKNLVLFGALLFALNTIAATDGVLHLRGVVGEELSIQVNAEAVASNLDLEQTQTDLLVATVTETSNSSTGYRVSVSSQNLGALEHVNGDRFNYDLKYNGQVVDLQNGEEFIESQGEVQENVRDVSISYTGVSANNMVAGDYSDNVTFSISAN